MGTGYTRNDTDNNIADGNVINAADFDGEFDAIVSAFSTSGHTHDGTSAEGGPVTVLGPAQDFVVSASAVTPKTTNTLDLGTSSLLFKDAFFDGALTTGTIVIDDAGSIGSASDTNAITISSGGVVAVTATTASSSATTGALTVAGGAGVAADLSVGDDLRLISDSSVLSFGADSDVTLTHVADTGLLLNSTMALQFNDSSQFINAPSATVLDINATDEIELNATLVDINANVEVSGTLTVAGAVDFGDAALSNVGAVQLDSIAGDGDTNTSITFSGSDVITVATGGSTAMTVDANQDVNLTNDLHLKHDAAVLNFGADNDVTLTHVADTGLLLNSTSVIQFNDASQKIGAPNATTLDIDATDEIELNATLVDVNANLDVSGTYTGAGLMTTGGNIVIPDAGNIGSASDTDAIAIGADGDVTLTQDLELQHDGATIAFGANDEITITHVHDTGLTVTNTNTGDNTPTVLQLKSEENEITANEVIGSIEFAAGDDSGTDAATVAAGIHAIAEAEFTSTVNSTKLVFTTGASETAAASAAASNAKMTLSSAGLLTIADDLVIKDGGTIGVASDADAITIASDGQVTFSQAISGTSADFDGGVTIDNITIDGTEIDLSSGDLTLDVAGDIILDASDSGIIDYEDGGVTFLRIQNSSSDAVIQSIQQDKDIIFKGNDGGGTITALTLDMGDAGAATFNDAVGVGMAPDSAVKLSVNGAVGPTNGSAGSPTHTFYSDPDTGMFRTAANTLGFSAGGTEYVQIGSFGVAADTLTNKTSSGSVTIDAADDIVLDAEDNGSIQLKDGGTYYGLLRRDNNDFQLYSIVQDGDMVFRGNDGGSNVTALTLDMSAAGAATFNSSITSGGNITVGGTNNLIINDSGAAVFGNDGDISIGNSGVNGSISTANGDLILDASGGIILDADDAGTISLKDDGTRYGVFAKSTNNFDIQSTISDGDIVFKGNDGGSGITALTLDMSEAGTATFNSNVGIGCTPNASSSGVNGLSVGDGGSAPLGSLVSDGASNTQTRLGHAYYHDGSNFKYETASVGVAIYQQLGNNAGAQHIFFSNAGGSEDANFTPTERMSISPTAVVINETGADQDFRVESANSTDAIRVDASGDDVIFGSSAAGNSNAYFGNVHSADTFFFVANNSSTTSTPPLFINRQNNDGSLIIFRQGNSDEGSIEVSGSTVSLSGFSGKHESSGISTSVEIGTVVSTIDELDVYPNTQPDIKTGEEAPHPKAGQDRADHAKVKVSDTEGDKRVYGVVSKFTPENKVMVTSLGIGSVKVTGACAGGDLLESNGDGTAKVQSDDIIRSKTIGKVTIGNNDTGVKLVSCVMYCG